MCRLLSVSSSGYQFMTEYRRGDRYEPDFVIETLPRGSFAR